MWVGGSQEPKLSRVRGEREWGPGSCEAEKRDLEIVSHGGFGVSTALSVLLGNPR